MLLGTLTNTATVLIGTGIGAVVGRRIPGRIREIITAALGLITAALAVRETLAGDRFVLVLGAVLLGAVVGETLRIEQGLEWLGRRLQTAISPAAQTLDVEFPEGSVPGSSGPTHRPAEGFVIASLIFCIGPLTILGSINDGLGDPELLLVKAGLDGFASIALAAVYGWGVGLSALTVLILQGGIALGAGALEGLLTDPMVDALGSAGGILLIGIALRLLDLKTIRVANMLPALVFAPLLVALFPG
jgi:uncharacterized membrane protein YqgA involved in biofilm formation